MKNFTAKQLEIIKPFGQGQAVVAGAGCGKTTTLVGKCLELIAQNPKARFCAVSFTEKSVRDLNESLTRGLESVGQKSGIERHWVRTFHGLCHSILSEYPIEAGLSGGEKILLPEEGHRMWAECLSSLWKSNEREDLNQALIFLNERYDRKQIESYLLRYLELSSFGMKPDPEDPYGLEMFRVFESVYARFQQKKKRLGLLDFSDLEKFALQALEDPRVRSDFHERFDLLMVDEFQDTNPVQSRLIEKFARPGFTNLCIVGDPKQSIYRFRDADVSLFEEWCDRLPKLHLLDTNYRSDPEIIQFVNGVCSDAFSRVKLRYDPLEAGVQVSPDTQAEPAVIRVEYEDDILETLSYFRHLRESKVSFNDVVILVRKMRTQGTLKLMEGLRSQDIPFILGAGGDFYQDPRVIELVSFLSGFASDLNRKSQMVALNAPWIQAKFEAFVQQEIDQPGHRSFFDQFFHTHEHPFSDYFRELYRKRGRVSALEILDHLQAYPGLSPEMEMPIFQVWYRCLELNDQGYSLYETAKVLTERIARNMREPEVPAPDGAGAIRIFTVHASKGLQFPIVILPDMKGPERRSSLKGAILWSRTLMGTGSGLSMPELDDEPSEKRKLFEEEEHFKSLQESHRVFYVALTRAQKKMVFLWKKVSDDEEMKENIDSWRDWIRRSGVRPMLWRPEQEFMIPNEGAPRDLSSRALHRDANTVESTRDSTAQKLSFEKVRLRHSATEWMQFDQCRLQYAYRMKKESSGFSEDEIESLRVEKVKFESTERSVQGKASEIGVQIHEWIEKGEWERLEDFFPVSELRALIPDRAGVQIFREFPFEFPLNGFQGMVGMIDRVEWDPLSKSVRIIDYKWSNRQRSDQEWQDRYRLQMWIYAHAIRELLRFDGYEPDDYSLSGELLILRKEGVKGIEMPIPAGAELKKQIDLAYQQRVQILKEPLSSIRGTVSVSCDFCEFRPICSEHS